MSLDTVLLPVFLYNFNCGLKLLIRRPLRHDAELALYLADQNGTGMIFLKFRHGFKPRQIILFVMSMPIRS